MRYYNIINLILKMSSLFVISENFTNGFRADNLDFISIVSTLCGVFVIISKNPIVSVLFLIGLFVCISAYLLILGINFIGLSYLLVYVGAVSILFLFILMLINVRISELLDNTSNSIPLAIIISVSFIYSVYQILPYSIRVSRRDIPVLSENKPLNISLNDRVELDNTELCFVTSKSWDSNLAETGHIINIGNIMYTSYSIWLILTSIILLLAMVGAIVITIKTQRY